MSTRCAGRFGSAPAWIARHTISITNWHRLCAARVVAASSASASPPTPNAVALKVFAPSALWRHSSSRQFEDRFCDRNKAA
jgi:hypothetical protein